MWILLGFTNYIHYSNSRKKKKKKVLIVRVNIMRLWFMFLGFFLFFGLNFVIFYLASCAFFVLLIKAVIFG